MKTEVQKSSWWIKNFMRKFDIPTADFSLYSHCSPFVCVSNVLDLATSNQFRTYSSGRLRRPFRAPAAAERFGKRG